MKIHQATATVLALVAALATTPAAAADGRAVVLRIPFALLVVAAVLLATSGMLASAKGCYTTPDGGCINFPLKPIPRHDEPKQVVTCSGKVGSGPRARTPWAV